jgi:hypothetical protein
MEDVDSIILEHPRAIRGDMSGIRDDMQEVKQRLSGLEAGIGG